MKGWYATASRLGFGAATGFHGQFNEKSGLLPSREYYVEKEGWWAVGHLLNLAIGQGAFLATPLQMARYVSALANGGYLVTPHVAGTAPAPKRIEGISRRTLNIVKESMRRVVYSPVGTGRGCASTASPLPERAEPPRPAGGDDAWFIAFAPFEKPEIAVAVIVEGGGGGGAVAAPVARAVFEACFEDRLAAAGPRSVPGAGGNGGRSGT